jgi:hypothetical protein
MFKTNGQHFFDVPINGASPVARPSTGPIPDHAIPAPARTSGRAGAYGLRFSDAGRPVATPGAVPID